jgi:hypothetical protein
MSAQLDELGGIRGLIADATKDTTRWLQADPSAEERAHVLAMQEGLADLDRIITRRMERRSLPNDGWQWSEIVPEVLSRLDKAREVRGNIVCKDSAHGLAHLAERLPRELPVAKKKPRLPKPVVPVSTGFTSFTLNSKRTQKPPSPPTWLPSDLWPRTCVILDEAIEKFPDQNQIPELCQEYISGMTPLYCEAVKAGKMTAAAVLQENLGGMLDLLDLLLKHNPDAPRSAYQIYQKARNSKEFRELARAIADTQAEMQRKGTTEARLRTDGKQPESARAQNSDKAAQGMEAKSINPAANPFTQSQDYRNVTIRGEAYTLTSRQAQMIQILDEARTNGSPDVGSDHIMVKLAGDARGETSRWQDTWKSNPKARKALIKSGTRKGTLRLNL